MKLIALLAAAALACPAGACFGQAADYQTQLPNTNPVQGMVLWWNGVRYELKGVVANDEGTITFSTSFGNLKVPWDRVPKQVQGACWNDRDRTLKEAANEKAEATTKALGVQRITGTVIQVLSDGILLDAGEQNVFVKADAGGLADGDHVSILAKPAGTINYTTVLGASATVHAYEFYSN